MPRARSIFPVDPRAAAINERLLRYCVYEIVEARPPPVFDFSHTLKQALLPSRLIPAFTRWQRQYLPLAAVAFLLAQGVSCVVLVADAPQGRLLAVLSCCMQLPLLVLAFAALCTDILVALTETFEFWFFTFANTATTVVMAMYFGDLRAVSLVAAWLAVQYNICIDAALRGFPLMVALLVVGILGQTFALFAIAFGVVPDVRLFQIADYGDQTVNSDDFLVNTIMTVIYMLGRALYRRVAMLRRHRERSDDAASQDIRFVRCVSYRCAVKLRPLTHAIVSRRERDHDAATTQAERQRTRRATRKSRVRFVELACTFDSRETMLCGRNLSMIRVPTWIQILFHSLGALGLSLTGFMFLILNYVRPYPPIIRDLSIASLALTIFYCFVCISLYHPALLKQLCLSVDFAYMVMQFLFGHVCAAYLFEWDDRAYVLASSMCWVTLMLTVDAFTPAARDRIGFRLIFIVPLLLLSITAHVLMTIEVTRRHSSWGLRDYTIIRLVAFGHDFELHVKPAFFNRVWMIVLWELRALWRILKASRHDLVMIYGAVDLDISRVRPRPTVSGPSLAHISHTVAGSTAGHHEITTATSIDTATS